MVCAYRQVHRILHLPDYIEIGHSWFYHYDIGAFFNIHKGFFDGFKTVGIVHLVSFLITKSGRTIKRITKRAIKTGSIFCAITHDTGFGKTIFFQRLSYRANASVHHITRRNKIGAGLCMTTRDVALNPNRNPGLSEAQVQAELEAALGAERVIWLDKGLLNDHTDGHIDNIARFIAPGRVLCMRAEDRSDPNIDVLSDIEGSLRKQGVEVVTLPSPGLVLGRDQRPLPASYLNFYIANHSVVVPVFGSPHDEAALTQIAALFPTRVVVPVPAKVFLHEGGTVHCIPQQEPAGAARAESSR